MTQILSWKSISRQVAKHRKALSTANALALLATCFGIPLPLLMPLAIDEIILKEQGHLLPFLQSFIPEIWHTPTGYVVALLIIALLLRLISLTLNITHTKQFAFIGKTISFSIREKLSKKLKRVALLEFESLGSGSLSSRCVIDVETIDKFIGETLSKIVVSVLSIIGTAIILLWIDWLLGLIILLLNPFVIYLSRAIGKNVKELKKNENKAFEVFQASLTEALDQIQQLKTANRQSGYFDRVSHAADQLKQNAIQFSWKSDAANKLSFTTFLSGFEVFRAIAILMVIYSDLSVGEIFAVFGYLWFMIGPVQELLNIQYSYFAANAALLRINEVLLLQEEKQHPAIHDPFQKQRPCSIHMENVSFHYQENTQVLENVNLTIPAGEKIAIVGASGGGKSTLVQVLLGLYEKQEGNIAFDNIPVEEIGYSRVRENIATVLQNPGMFNATIRENLCMGNEHADQDLWQALAISQLDQFVASCENGLDTIIGNQGVRFSGGQKQRLAIARMLLSEPNMIILDEATSALDTKTEARLHAALSEYFTDRTVIIIAHRLSAIQQADKIYVFEDGQVVQSGHHQELIHQDGLYRTLYG
ncbi:ABC transporter ATP-binding protein [Algicola sagamiensis]|uniref:ABC transporter ATP-binding protein n=1 Tax=Algicola sagamiensis TaxID=163869 RepID=UPI00039F0FB4|nr:ABC transporter ATP-binding protein [Algicola sagamiensis]